jgi:hypothetical protein
MNQRSSTIARLFVFMLVAGPATAFGQTQDQQKQDAQTCVDVQVGSDRSYSCLNRQLERLVPGKRPSSQDAPYSASSPAPQVGTFNQAATRERMGNAFGHSVVPQRPPPPVFTPPVLQRR